MIECFEINVGMGHTKKISYTPASLLMVVVYIRGLLVVFQREG